MAAEQAGTAVICADEHRPRRLTRLLRGGVEKALNYKRFTLMLAKTIFTVRRRSFMVRGQPPGCSLARAARSGGRASTSGPGRPSPTLAPHEPGRPPPAG